MIEEVVNIKFDVHLRYFGDDFDQAKIRIKHCSLEQQVIHKKIEKYAALWDLISKDDESCQEYGLDRTKVMTFYQQFKQRELTLICAIKELEANYGIMIVERKVSLNGLRKEQALIQSLKTTSALTKVAAAKMETEEEKDNKSEQLHYGTDGNTEERLVLYNPNQSSQGQLSDFLDDISDCDIDEDRVSPNQSGESNQNYSM